MNKYTPIIGLEVHVELKTKSKMFCSCSADYFGKEPNTHVCPVCLGLPGALPVPNKQALDWCVMIAMALNCEIAEYSKFDRKNYFYPDLSKGYQISQYDLPFGENGFMQLSSGNKVRVRRVHMEEDTGKLTHSGDSSLIDFNRSGLPLVEIVTEPDFHDAKDVTEYLQNLRQIVRYLDVSNADMEKGDMRLEPNISLATDVNVLPNYKVEVKNINSFRFVEKAIEFEIKRHETILENGETPVQETRGWNEDKALTFSQRAKEEANDYRYFPEPDIPPFEWKKAELDTLRKQLPELPQAKRARFVKEYELSDYNAEILTRERTMADYVEEAIKLGKANLTSKDIANWIINKKINPDETTVEKLVADVVASKQVATVDEKELERVIAVVFSENEKAVTDYKSGKESVIMFLVGQVMKRLSVKPDARIVKEKLEKSLKN